MKTTVTELEGSRVRLDVEVPGEEVGSAIDRTVRGLSKQVKIPGFRKGKVPPEVVVQRFGIELVVREMLEEELPKWYAQAVEQSGIAPVDQPDIDFEQAPEQDQAFAFQAEVPVMPTPELGPYKELEVPKAEVEVADEEVDVQVERLREEFSELRPVEGRAVQEGDHATVDFAGRLDGDVVDQTSAEDYVLEIGSNQLLPDLEQGIVGMEAGEEKTVPVTFPDDYPSEDVAGKTVDFDVTVKEIKEKVLPELNDEFAKDVSEFETLLELRLDIRRKIRSGREDQVERSFRSAAIKQAADNATIDIPESVVDGQARDMITEFAQSLTHQGTNLEQYMQITGTSVEQLIADVRPQAEDTVRASLVLEQIAAEEGLEITDAELDERLAKMAEAAQMEPSEYRSRVEDSGRMDAVREQMLREKAADVIVQSAVAVEPPQADEVDEDEASDEAEEAAENEGSGAQPESGSEDTDAAERDDEERTAE